MSVYNIDIWWNMLTKFNNQIGNSFVKTINTKLNSKPCQTTEMELLPQVVTGFRGELKNLAIHLIWTFLQK